MSNCCSVHSSLYHRLAFELVKIWSAGVKLQITTWIKHLPKDLIQIFVTEEIVKVL
jgi:hypothetical protein